MRWGESDGNHRKDEGFRFDGHRLREFIIYIYISYIIFKYLYHRLQNLASSDVHPFQWVSSWSSIMIPGHMEGAPHFQTIIQLSNDYPMIIQLKWISTTDSPKSFAIIQWLSNTGWWFQICFIFHFIYRIILPIDELIFFKMVIAPPTSLPLAYPFINGIIMDLSQYNGIIKMVKTTNQNSSKWFFQNPLAPPKKVTIESMYCRYGMQADGRSQSLGCTVLGTNTWPGPQTVSESWIFQKSNMNRSTLW